MSRLLKSQLRIENCWEHSLSGSSRQQQQFFFPPDIKHVALSEHNDKWHRPRAAVLHSTCFDSYLSFWTADLDQLQRVSVGGWGGRGSPLPSWLKPRDSPLKPNDTRLTPERGGWYRLILCFKTAHSQLLRDRASFGCVSFISHLLSVAPLFFPRQLLHIKAQLWILRRKWAEDCVLGSLSWYAGETIEAETDRES